VVDARQDLPLVAESPHKVRAVDTWPQQLDGYRLLELVVIASGQIDGARTAAPDLSNETVCADDLRHGWFVESPESIARVVHGLEHVAETVVRNDQAPNLVTKRRIVGAGPLEKGGTVRGRQLDRTVEQIAHLDRIEHDPSAAPEARCPFSPRR
jgi:hypothetical protein